jgi:hypothetical protein
LRQLRTVAKLRTALPSRLPACPTDPLVIL